MSRPLRIEFSGAYYHVMNRGLASQSVFQDEEDREFFLNLLGEVHQRWNLQIFAYCLMTNHYHLSVQTPTAFLSRIMRHINGVYTQEFNRRHKRDGPLFRGRYKAILVEKFHYFLTVIRYIHRNPLDSGAANRTLDYQWTSGCYYLSERKKPGWLDAETVLDQFGGERSRFRNFLTGDEAEGEGGYQPERQGPLFGSEAFKAKVRAMVKLKIKEPEIPEKKFLSVPIKTCVKTVSAVYGTDEEWIKKSLRGRKNEPRQVAMYLCREAGGYRHREIAEALKAGSYSTVSSACALLKKRMKKEEGLRKRVITIYNQIMGQSKSLSDLTPIQTGGEE